MVGVIFFLLSDLLQFSLPYHCRCNIYFDLICLTSKPFELIFSFFGLLV